MVITILLRLRFEPVKIHRFNLTIAPRPRTRRFVKGDNWLRRMVLRTHMFESDQYYFRTREVAGMIQSCGLTSIAEGSVLKFPMDLYRKLPITKFLKQLDSSKHWPSWFATLGFAIGRKDGPEARSPA